MTNKCLSHFCCDFVTNNFLEDNCFYANSYLRQNQLKCLLEKSDDYCNHWTYGQTIDLFGLKIDVLDLDTNLMKVMFTFVKKTLNELRTDSRTRIEGNDYEVLRNNVTIFSTLLKRRLFEVCIQCKLNVNQNESKNTFIISVMKQMKALLLFVGRLSQIKPQLIRLAVSSDSKSAIFNYFHCCLDIWWTAIEMMYILDQNSETNFNDLALIKDQISGQRLCLQTIEIVFYDLIVLSVNRFSEMKESNKYHSLSLFDCLCIKELYVLVRHMHSATNKSVINDSFFELIFSTLNELTDKTVSTDDKNSNNWYPINEFKSIAFGVHSLDDSSLHFIWFVTNVIQTLSYDISGQYCQSFCSQSIPTPLLRKITQFLRQNESNLCEKLSPVIIFCLNCINFWKPNTDILLPFADYFLKNINKSFFKTTVEELAVVPKTSSKWCQITREISNNRNNVFMENSFHLFLSLMSKQLILVSNKCETRTKLMNLHKFKGKISINISSTRLKTFDETAIFNLFSLYLVLVNTSEDVYIDFIDNIIDTNCQLLEVNNSLKNSEIVLKFMFAMIQTKPKSLSDDKISNFIGKTFKNVCEDSQKVKNPNLVKQFSYIIVLYFDELKTLVKSNEFLELSFDKLLNFNLIAISNLYSTYDQRLFVINFISDLLKTIIKNTESEEMNSTLIPVIIKICFDSYLPFIRKEISDKNDDQILSEIAFNFTKISNKGFRPNPHKLCSIFKHFLEVSPNNCQFLSTYLCLILRDSQLTENLKRDEDINCILISIWCNILVTPDVDQTLTDELTSCLSHNIEDMRSGLTSNNVNSSEIFINFVKNLSLKLSNSDPINRLASIQKANKYFMDMIITSEEVIKNSSSINSVKRIYTFISCLLSIGSHLLYNPSTTDCLLTKIIGSLLMPNISIEMRPKLVPILQKAFPLFIEGLFKLQIHYNGNEYIERQIRRIISYYLPLYVNHSNAYINLKNQLEERNIYKQWTKHLLSTIIHNFFNRHESCSISDLMPYIQQFCKFDLTDDQLIDVFNAALIKTWFTDRKSKQSLLSLISCLSAIFAKNKKEGLLFDTKVFSDFIETNLLNNSFSKISEVIKSISKSCPHLFHHFIGQITRTLESVERKRSVGIDNSLRTALREFANQRLDSI